jgi:ATP-dependent helicase HrpA
VAGHVLKTQLLEPHWQKTAARVVAFERATLYGLVVYSNRPVDYGRIDPAAARELFIREALVGDGWETRLPFLAHNRRLVREIEALEHKARRQDVLVDESLIHAYYDRHVPADVASGVDFERWYRRAAAQEPRLLYLGRDELMRHEAAGVTTAAFPPTLRLGGVDCTVAYLHAPGDPKDGMTVTLPIYALNRASEERAEWLVPGLLKDKVVALLKSLPQRPRSRLVPLAETAAAFVESTPFGEGSLVERLLAAVRERTQLPLQRADFKLETLAPHWQMNFRLVDETGRQLALGRDLAGLKAQFGSQARSAFQALAALGTTLGAAHPAAPAAVAAAAPAAAAASRPAAAAPHPRTDAVRYTDWSFGLLPELMELRRGTQALVGFPALVDRDTHVELEVFDEPAVAAARHRAGLVRLFALQLREPQRHLERSLPEFAKAAVLYMAQGGTADALRRQIVDVAIERAFLAGPLPADAAAFARRLEEGRPRFVLIAQEVARLASAILAEAAAAQRKLKDARVAPEVADDVAAQLARLVPKSFLRSTPWERLQQLPRYLKAVQLRLDKWRSDPARDRARMDELRPLEQRYLRRLAELKGAPHERLDEFRWLLEELRVGLFAQELRTPQPVSTKRLEKAWAQLAS